MLVDESCVLGLPASRPAEIADSTDEKAVIQETNNWRRYKFLVCIKRRKKKER
jgi:hypothetical protein